MTSKDMFSDGNFVARVLADAALLLYRNESNAQLTLCQKVGTKRFYMW